MARDARVLEMGQGAVVRGPQANAEVVMRVPPWHSALVVRDFPLLGSMASVPHLDDDGKP